MSYMSDRVVRNAKVRLTGGPLNKTLLDMENFIVKDNIFIHPKVHENDTAEANGVLGGPKQGYHRYTIWDDWPLRYKYSGTVGTLS